MSKAYYRGNRLTAAVHGDGEAVSVYVPGPVLRTLTFERRDVVLAEVAESYGAPAAVLKVYGMQAAVTVPFGYLDDAHDFVNRIMSAAAIPEYRFVEEGGDDG